jgi:hypothetical protein
VSSGRARCSPTFPRSRFPIPKSSPPTPFSSVANIIVAERAKDVAPIRFRDYFRVGLPVTVATLLFGSIWLWLID